MREKQLILAACVLAGLYAPAHAKTTDIVSKEATTLSGPDVATSPKTADSQTPTRGEGAWLVTGKPENRSAQGTNNWPANPKNDLTRKLVISTLLVIVLGAAAFYLSKKFLPKIALARGRQICVVETVYLAPNKAIHLLSVGAQKLLVGTSKENIHYLADVTNALPDAQANQPQDANNQK
jgi:flagellar biogenesis protein FliO